MKSEKATGPLYVRHANRSWPRRFDTPDHICRSHGYLNHENLVSVQRCSSRSFKSSIELEGADGIQRGWRPSR